MASNGRMGSPFKPLRPPWGYHSCRPTRVRSREAARGIWYCQSDTSRQNRLLNLQLHRPRTSPWALRLSRTSGTIREKYYIACAKRTPQRAAKSA